MGNSGKNSNSSQFFFTFAPAPACDGKHVVFGEIVSGFDVLERLEAAGSDTGEPTISCTITGCGQYFPSATPGAGYVYDIPDNDAYSGFVTTFMAHLRVAIVVPSEQALARFQDVVQGCVLIQTPDYQTAQKMASSHAVDLIVVAQALAEQVPKDAQEVLIATPANLMSKIRGFVPTLQWAEESVSLEDVLRT
jgi:hypothetical protein